MARARDYMNPRFILQKMIFRRFATACRPAWYFACDGTRMYLHKYPFYSEKNKLWNNFCRFAGNIFCRFAGSIFCRFAGSVTRQHEHVINSGVLMNSVFIVRTTGFFAHISLISFNQAWSLIPLPTMPVPVCRNPSNPKIFALYIPFRNFLNLADFFTIFLIKTKLLD